VFDAYVLLPQYSRASGRIVNGVLSFGIPVLPSQAEYTFRLPGADLAGTYKEGTVESVVTVAPVGDVRQVGCPLGPGVVRGPSGTIRDRILAQLPNPGRQNYYVSGA